jgi:tRNA modification GTPase
MIKNDTIVALATPQGAGAIAIIRLSGSEAFDIAEKIFVSKKKIASQKTQSIHFGKIIDSENQEIIDDVLLSIFKNPHSYTGEDVVEISCHGSPYIIQKIISQCTKHGARTAFAGEFTQRAFFNSKMDLSQAEAVADIIASENKMQHEIAFKQMRGNYSKIIADLRAELIEFAALIELELDFSEEDVAFANREKFISLLAHIQHTVAHLIQSFTFGNVIKNGIPVVIIGEPNVGKSTLLNKLLQEEKAIVSDIAGTTRDVIEDTFVLDGILFRLVDTAGIHITDDVLEKKGIERTYEKIARAKIILYLEDIEKPTKKLVDDLEKFDFKQEQEVIILLTKSDKIHFHNVSEIVAHTISETKKTSIAISATTNFQLEKVEKKLVEIVQQEKNNYQEIIVTNTRHLEYLQKTQHHISEIQNGIESKLSGDLLSIDIKLALRSLGEITGVVELDRDILGTIFSKFCIGK